MSIYGHMRILLRTRCGCERLTDHIFEGQRAIVAALRPNLAEMKAAGELLRSGEPMPEMVPAPPQRVFECYQREEHNGREVVVYLEK